MKGIERPTCTNHFICLKVLRLALDVAQLPDQPLWPWELHHWDAYVKVSRHFKGTWWHNFNQGIQQSNLSIDRGLWSQPNDYQRHTLLFLELPSVIVSQQFMQLWSVLGSPSSSGFCLESSKLIRNTSAKSSFRCFLAPQNYSMHNSQTRGEKTCICVPSLFEVILGQIPK